MLTCSVTLDLAGHTMPPHMGKYSSQASCATSSDMTPIHRYEWNGLMEPAVKNAAWHQHNTMVSEPEDGVRCCLVNGNTLSMSLRKAKLCSGW